MDAVVVLCYLILVTPTAMESELDGAWPAAVLPAAALLFRRAYPLPAVAAVAAIEVAVTLMHPWGSNVSAGLSTPAKPASWCRATRIIEEIFRRQWFQAHYQIARKATLVALQGLLLEFRPGGRCAVCGTAQDSGRTARSRVKRHCGPPHFLPGISNVPTSPT
ncbi:hypothetical protein QFZ79_001215 [Arthrobacter sp. V4I6]|uniref:hypothetical protein n=1 Tax=unclassified Arthrobacter TaxID=235627 RepID=UPI0027814D22|nr:MULTISPECIES: hypothetical protein [unclassified Arthrobacter]MDQ0823469.1 hypothetical protein [Arthrobacter sp. V1I7]MDQ0853104.1 hypothetical protein [Arthrobacter sp. V4I6]